MANSQVRGTEFFFTAYGATEKGADYEVNHDALILPLSSPTVLGVLDGVGNKRLAADASAAASTAIQSVLEKATPQSVEGAERLMNLALAAGNTAIPPSGRTTASIVKLWDTAGEPSFATGNVGDSNVFIVRDGQLIQLTEEQPTYSDERLLHEIDRLARNAASAEELAELLRDHYHDNVPSYDDYHGSLSIATAYFNYHRRFLMSALGEQPRYTVSTHRVERDDKVLLLTDGITDPLTHDMIAEIATTNPVEQVPNALLLAANNDAPEIRKQDDDRTAIIATIG